MVTSPGLLHAILSLQFSILSFQACHLMGGFLAEPRSKEDQDFFEQVFDGYSWIGLRRSGSVWIWDKDGEALTEPTNWFRGQPNGDGDCVHLTTDGWWDISCDYQIDVLCQY